MNSLVENQINEFFIGNVIVKREILSEAFGMRCEKISLANNEILIAKYYLQKKTNFNSILSEINSLSYLSKIIPSIFPAIRYKSDDLMIIDFIKNNNIKKNDYQIILAREILKLHTITNNKYGFVFDAQIGGLKQLNTFETNWASFFLNNRLNMIFEKINKNNPMPISINMKIEKIMKNINSFLPKNPKISLLHGDLWEGNILFNNGKLVGLIDPGIYFGHNELEIAYLTWFKFVDNKFLNFYSDTLSIDKYFSKYEPIYQLYFSLLNIYLWDRNFYLKDTNKLLNKVLNTRIGVK